MQADVVSLSIRGLAAFSTILEAFSMDNVSPAAVLQLEQLGNSFLISGKYAERLPDYLQRNSQTPLGRLSLSVGWRKGDTAALLSETPGGQAIALLCLCIFSIYRSEPAATFLMKPSQALLPAKTAVSSISQLAAIGDLPKAKIGRIGVRERVGKTV